MLTYTVALCDDEQFQLDRTSRTLAATHHEERGEDKYKTTLEVKQFIDGQELLASLPDVRYDAFILDIQMPSINGLELARQIRNNCGEETPIILLTAFPGYALDGYKVRALRYILKDDLENGFREVLPVLLNKVENNSEQYTLLEGGQILPVKPEHIYYFESQRNYVQVYYHDAAAEDYNTQIRCTLTELARIMATKGFTQNHRSFLVNRRKIREVRPKEIVLVNGTVLPLSRDKELYATLLRTVCL